MKTLIILAHPNIQQSVVNKSWIEALQKTLPEVKVHDIYSQYPDWNIDIEAEQTLLSAYDRIIFQYPIYWYSVPPLLKKWLDDVLAYGWAYGSTGGKLKDKEFGLAVSTGGAKEAYTPEAYGTINEFLKPMLASIKFIQGQSIGFHVFHGALSPDAQERLELDLNPYLAFIKK